MGVGGSAGSLFPADSFFQAGGLDPGVVNKGPLWETNTSKGEAAL